MYYVKKSLRDFPAAHRLTKNYSGRCQNLHGHNYLVTVTFAAEHLDKSDFVIDFMEVDTLCDQWILDTLDHSIILNEEDKVLLNFVKEQDLKYFVMPNNQNPTAECIAEVLYHQFQSLIQQYCERTGHKLKIVEVELAETKDSIAIYRND